jgi:hypothetical protein
VKIKDADKKLREDLELLKTDELIDIIIDQSQQLEKHEAKQRHNVKQGKADVN